MMKVNAEETAQRSMVTGLRGNRALAEGREGPGLSIPASALQHSERGEYPAGRRGLSCSSGGGGGGGPEGGRPGRARMMETTLMKC